MLGVVKKTISILQFDEILRKILDLPRLPNEWDAWLRHSRQDPPTAEEIAKNRASAALRAQKGKEIEVSSTPSLPSNV